MADHYDIDGFRYPLLDGPHFGLGGFVSFVPGTVTTAPRRRSAVMVRRLPWFRRFAPRPDGSLSAGDRAQMTFTYRTRAPARGPANIVAGSVWSPGLADGSVWSPGATLGSVWSPGVSSGSVGD